MEELKVLNDMEVIEFIKLHVKKYIAKTKFTLKSIFADNWDGFCHHVKNIRKVVLIEVDKLISCGTLDKGFAIYTCDCGEFLFVPFTCKSRLCPSCGIKYAQDRANSISEKCINCNHRHLVFTIPQELRSVFRENRNLLDILFSASSEVLFSYFKQLNKKEQFKPGFISSIHTFGRDLKWNPHIHILLSEVALGNLSSKKVTYLPYEMLRKRWQTTLLYALQKALGKRPLFTKLKCELYAKNQNGFYVYAKPKKYNNLIDAINYIIRYCGRPCMAQSRIIDYDGDFVTFWYQRHDDNKYVVEKIHVYEFIKRIIVHIPERYFNTIRYYGIYAKPKVYTKNLLKLVTDNAKKLRATIYKNWRNRINYFFNIDPLLCKCGKIMTYSSIIFNSS